jgi:amino acid transporter
VGGMWQVAGSRWRVAEIMTSVNIIVSITSLMPPQRRNLTMPHNHGVDNRSLSVCWNGRKLDLGESRSPTQIFQRKLVLASHGYWALVCAITLGLMVMIGMVMIAMVMMAMMIAMVVMVIMLVMVIIVPEAHKQLSSLRQH